MHKQSFRSTNNKKQKKEQLYLNTPVWLAVIKIGGTGLIMSFLTAFFLFITQITIICFMLQTNAYSFYNLFIHNKDVFNSLLLSDIKLSFNLIKAIANSYSLGIYSANSVIRSSVTLVIALLFLVQMFPSIGITGVTLFYAKALSNKQFSSVIDVWETSIVAIALISFLGFLLMIILTPTVTPTQAVKSTFSAQQIQILQTKINNHLKDLNYTNAFVKNNILSIYWSNNNYYLPVLFNNKIVYLNITNTNIINTSINSSHLINPTLIKINTSNLLTVWNDYFAQVRTYSIQWAQSFLYIMSMALIIQCFGGLFTALLRTDGELQWTTTVSVISILVSVLFAYLLIDIAQLGLVGSAISCVLGFLFQLICYMLLLQFHPKSSVRFNDLKNFSVHWKMILKMISRGLNKLIAGGGNMIALVILTNQITVVSDKLLPASGSEYFTAILGGVMPFIALFTSTISGSSKNMIQMFSYNYARNNKKRVYETYWWGFIYILIFSLIIFLLFGVYSELKTSLLNIFSVNATSGNNELASALKLMLIFMIQIPCFALMLPSTVVFLVADKMKLAYLVAALRTSVVPIPIIFIFSAIATNSSNHFHLSSLPYDNEAMWFFLANVPTYAALYSIILFTMSTIFLYTKMFKKQDTKINDVQNNVAKNN